MNIESRIVEDLHKQLYINKRLLEGETQRADQNYKMYVAKTDELIKEQRENERLDKWSKYLLSENERLAELIKLPIHSENCHDKTNSD